MPQSLYRSNRGNRRLCVRRDEPHPAARSDGSGKGVNVALAARALGHEAACVGLLNENGGAMVEERLKAAGVACGFAKAKGEVRTNLKVFDRSSQRITEINESGKIPEEAQLRQLEALVDRYAAWADVMVFTGSLPPGLRRSIMRA